MTAIQFRRASVTALLAGFLALPALTPSHGQDASLYDLATNEGVNAAREALTGRQIDERSRRCLRRSTFLPIIAVGTFVFDRGCRFEGVFVKSRYFKTGENETWKDALEVLGWHTANSAEREKMALAWVEESWLAFLTVLTQRNDDFQDHPFQPPAVVSNENGEIVATLWVRQPSRGRGKGRSYQFREFKFARNGAFISATTRANFTARLSGAGP